MFSQNEEEKYILQYFEGQTGTFIDIGANDGVTLSNTRALSDLGWKGILVEPSPKAFERLKANYEGRTGFYFYPFAIGKHNGNDVLQESGTLLNAGDLGLVSTFEHSEMQRFKSVCTYEPVTVKTFKWKTFLNRVKYKTFDFISLDIEGQEMHVLPEMDLSKTRLVCIEWNSKPELKTEYDKYMEGFNVIYTSGENLIYAR